MASSTEYVWRPQAGPQHALVDCPLSEVFFGGARGGGKTDGVLGKWAVKEKRYGSAFNAIAFRRTSVSFEDAIERAKQIYLPLGAKFTEKPTRFRMPNGGRISFAYLETIGDAAEYQGRNVTDTWIEEAGQFASPEPLDRLFGVLRSATGVPVQQILTANPGGPGQHWMADRYELIPFPAKPKIVTRILPNGQPHRMAVIPSRITDNRILVDGDPDYINRLQLVGSAALVKAWVNGDWSAIEGAYFDGWDEARHVVAPFSVPSSWLRFRSMDWGSASPFSVGWWAVVSDDYTLAGGRLLPRGAIVRYREWYGASAPNKGLKLTAEEIAEGVAVRQLTEKVEYGVIDTSAFNVDGGPSLAHRMMAHRPHIRWRPSNKVRLSKGNEVGGWDMMRHRLRGDGEHPMMFVFSTCKALIRQIATAQHNPDKPEDLDTKTEDHALDEARYACMSRPYIPKTNATAERQAKTGYSATRKTDAPSILTM